MTTTSELDPEPDSESDPESDPRLEPEPVVVASGSDPVPVAEGRVGSKLVEEGDESEAGCHTR